MRTQLIEVDTLEEARDVAPWASKIIEVEGGYLAFESLADYETWCKQT